jgi:drug/metabolite transporter (DMT)-like permease
VSADEAADLSDQTLRGTFEGQPVPPTMTSMRFFDRRPALAGIAGALCIAFSAIFVRLADVSVSTAAVFRCVYALPLLWLLARAERRNYGARTWRDRRPALIAGLFFAADLIFWHISIEFVGAGLATVLGNTQVLFVALTAWLLLREKPHLGAFVAIPVVLIGVVLISGVLGEGAYGDDPVLGVVFGILTGIAYTGFLLVLRHGNEDIRRPAEPLLDASLVGAIGAAAAGTFMGDLDLVPSWPAHGWLLLLGVTSQVVGWLLISISLPRLPAAMTSIILTLQPVGSMVLGVALLSEDPSAFQVVGVVVILIGISVARLGHEHEEDPIVAPRPSPATSEGVARGRTF